MRPERQERQDRQERQAGFTLIEMVVTLIVLSMVLIFTLNMFDANTRLSQTQSSVSDMQQNHRIGHYELLRQIRMAGRGSLGMVQFPDGEAIQIINNVPANTTIDGGGAGGNFPVVQGTDIIKIRGVFSSPVYTVIGGSLAFITAGGPPPVTTGSLLVANTSAPNIQIYQSLQPLQDALATNDLDMVVLTSSINDEFHTVVQLDEGNSTAGNPTTIAFTTNVNSAPWSPALSTLSSMGIVEEYWYYISNETLKAGDAGSSLRPKLVRARVDAMSGDPTLPFDTTVYQGDVANWYEPVADNMIDLQAVFGVDRSIPADLVVTETTDGSPDEWLYNHANDAAVTWAGGRLFFLRVNTVAITERPDTNYEAPIFGRVEDHTYTAAAGDLLNGTGRRQYRRRVQQTLVDLRNL